MARWFPTIKKLNYQDTIGQWHLVRYLDFGGLSKAISNKVVSNPLIEIAPEVGDVFYSPFFKKNLEVAVYHNENDWKFKEIGISHHHAVKARSKPSDLRWIMLGGTVL